MFAVVDILGQQFKVSENNKYYVPRLTQEPESEITFDKVLLLSDGKETKVGNPVVEGAKVTAKVLEHL
ncbi:MAG TPA: 50S ribosomal protein L21, partial [Ignavibacteriaceae bacterium]|nr:50S ribosomal protein L21 [Ignavibacteriaceae bacterium]